MIANFTDTFLLLCPTSTIAPRKTNLVQRNENLKLVLDAMKKQELKYVEVMLGIGMLYHSYIADLSKFNIKSISTYQLSSTTLERFDDITFIDWVRNVSVANTCAEKEYNLKTASVMGTDFREDFNTVNEITGVLTEIVIKSLKNYKLIVNVECDIEDVNKELIRLRKLKGCKTIFIDIGTNIQAYLNGEKCKLKDVGIIL